MQRLQAWRTQRIVKEKILEIPQRAIARRVANSVKNTTNDPLVENKPDANGAFRPGTKAFVITGEDDELDAALDKLEEKQSQTARPTSSAPRP